MGVTDELSERAAAILSIADKVERGVSRPVEEIALVEHAKAIRNALPALLDVAEAASEFVRWQAPGAQVRGTQFGVLATALKRLEAP